MFVRYHTVFFLNSVTNLWPLFASTYSDPHTRPVSVSNYIFRVHLHDGSNSLHFQFLSAFLNKAPWWNSRISKLAISFDHLHTYSTIMSFLLLSFFFFFFFFRSLVVSYSSSYEVSIIYSVVGLDLGPSYVAFYFQATFHWLSEESQLGSGNYQSYHSISGV